MLHIVCYHSIRKVVTINNNAGLYSLAITGMSTFVDVADKKLIVGFQCSRHHHSDYNVYVVNAWL